MNKCILCPNTKNLVKHHTNYEKDKTVVVCRNCHSKIHRTNLYQELKPIDRPNAKVIRISDEFHAELEQKGKKGESFEEFLKRLIDDKKR